jgi:hypothetical protein
VDPGDAGDVLSVSPGKENCRSHQVKQNSVVILYVVAKARGIVFVFGLGRGLAISDFASFVVRIEVREPIVGVDG